MPQFEHWSEHCHWFILILSHQALNCLRSRQTVAWKMGGSFSKSKITSCPQAPFYDSDIERRSWLEVWMSLYKGNNYDRYVEGDSAQGRRCKELAGLGCCKWGRIRKKSGGSSKRGGAPKRKHIIVVMANGLELDLNNPEGQGLHGTPLLSRPGVLSTPQRAALVFYSRVVFCCVYHNTYQGVDAISKMIYHESGECVLYKENKVSSHEGDF